MDQEARQPRLRRARPHRHPRRRRADGRMKGIVTDRRHRRRRRAGSHRGHPEDRRYRGPRRAVSLAELPRDDAEARRLAGGACSSARCSPPPPWRTSKTRSRAPWCWRCSCPLIISSGGNSGSQASTLVIRAMALGELQLRDWWRVIQRELVHRPRARCRARRRSAFCASSIWQTCQAASTASTVMLIALTVVVQPGRRRHLRDAGGLAAAVHPAPARHRPRHRLRALRRHARRRHRPRHLLLGRDPLPARQTSVSVPLVSSCTSPSLDPRWWARPRPGELRTGTIHRG